MLAGWRNEGKCKKRDMKFIALEREILKIDIRCAFNGHYFPHKAVNGYEIDNE
jgi:hypothetical protein